MHSIRRISRLLDQGRFSCEQLVTFCLSRARQHEAAFCELVSAHDLLAQALAADDRRRHDQKLSLLDGIPISVKENVAVKGLLLRAGSRMLEDVRAGYSADVVQQLVSQGAIVVGNTVMDEFGMGSLGVNLVHGGRLGMKRSQYPAELIDDDALVKEILDPSSETAAIQDNEEDWYAPGGSSCGSAVSVALGSSLLSVATDTGGSVRLPAAWCGVVGLKPSYGRISRHGIVSYASSLDCVGLLGSTVDCVHIGLEACAPTERDPTAMTDLSLSQPTDTVLDTKIDDPSQWKVGIPEAFSVEEGSEQVEAWQRSMDKLDEAGVTMEVVPTTVLSVEIVQASLAAYYVIASAEASSNLARYDGLRYGSATPIDRTSKMDIKDSIFSVLEQQYAASRADHFGQEVTRRILCGTAVLSSDQNHTYFEAATKIRASLTRQLNETMRRFDAMLTPTSCFGSPRLDALQDKTSAFANDVMTTPVSLVGLPALSVPVSCSASRRGPVAVQVIGNRGQERKMTAVARLLQTNGGDDR